jgi:prevent-host-death family protein
MRTVNVHEAKTHLSRLLAQVEAGEEVIIARGGKPVARLVPVDVPADRRVPGLDKGRLKYSEDVEAPLPSEVAADFEV